MVKNYFIFFLLILLGACSNSNKDELFKKYKTVCAELELSKCALESRYATDSKSGKNEDLILSFQESFGLTKYYKENPEYLLGKIANEMSLFMDSLSSNSYSNIYIEGIINNKRIEKKYSIEELKKARKLFLITDSFFDATNSQSYNKIENLIDKGFISDSTMNATFKGIEQMSKCGLIEENSILGFDFDKIAKTGKEVTIIVKYLKRKASQEIITFYFLNETNKIIFIGIKSSSDCA